MTTAFAKHVLVVLTLVGDLPIAGAEQIVTQPLQIYRDSSAIYFVRISPDGTKVLTGGVDRTAKLWDASSGALLRTFSGHTGPVFSVAFSPDGTKILTAAINTDATAKLWDASDGTLIRTFAGHTASVCSAVFSPDGTKVLTGSVDGTARIWNAADGTVLLTISAHAAGPYCVAFSPDGMRVLTGGGDYVGRGWATTAKIWNASNGSLLQTFYHNQWDFVTVPFRAVNTVAFSPDGTKILTGSDPDTTVKLWNAASGALIRTFSGHTAGITWVAFSPDGTKVLTTAYQSGNTQPDNTAKLWRASDGLLLLTYSGHTAGVECANFSPNGTKMVTASDDGTARLWPVFEPCYVSFGAASSTAAESAATVTMRVNLSEVTTSPVTVTYTVSGTATSGADYDPLSGALTFDPGQIVKDIVVRIIDDSLDEPDETVVLTLTAATGAQIGTPPSHVLTITDDDESVGFLEATSTVLESGEMASIQVRLTRAVAWPVDVIYGVEGTASAGVDYVAPSGMLRLDAGETTKNITIAILDDSLDEPDETVVLTLTAATGADIGTPPSHVLTIADDDHFVQFSDAASTVAESVGTANIHVCLSEPALMALSVTYTVGGTATPGADYDPLSGTLTFDPGQTVKDIVVRVIDDSLDEPHETVVLTLTAATGAQIGTPPSHVLTITDDDEPPPEVPNLAIASADAGPVSPVQLLPGAPLVLGAFVENTGIAQAGPFWLEFWGSRTGGLTLDLFLADSVVLGPLGPGGAIPFAAEKALYNVPDGRYTVVIAADRPDVITESNERDNRAVVAWKRLLVFRPPGAADIAVAQMQDFSFGPNPAYNRQAIQLGGQIENIGTVDTGPFWIEFWGSYNRVDPQLGFFLCDSILVQNLVPGQSVNLSDHARTLYDCPTGVFMVGLYVDRLGRVNEADETNNYIFIDGVALNQPRPAPALRLAGPDLVIASADFEPSALVIVGPNAPLNIQARIENRGTMASEPFWVEFWGAKLGGLYIQAFLVDSEPVVGMPAGGWIDLNLTRPLCSIPDGAYTVTLLVDRPNQVAETDETNNRLAVAGKRLLTMRPDTAVNLVVEDFAVRPTWMTHGRPITLGGRLRNAGAEDSGPFWIEFWGSHNMDYPDLGFLLCDSLLVWNLAPGALVDLSAHQRDLYSGLPVGKCAVVCFADRTDLVNETNEADNYQVLRNYSVEARLEGITIILPGNVPLVLKRVPPGSFQMGSPDTERSRHTDEGPVHTVNIAYDFYMGKYELTQQQWLALMGRWPGTAPSSIFGLGDNFPAYYISWYDAQNFIAALNTHVTNTDQGPATFRLPGEAEWEYACRAGTQTRFSFGDSLSVDDLYADGPAGTLPGNRSDYMWWWFNCKGDANGTYGSKPVGTKLPNQFGLYDMSGNVLEWCQDWQHGSYTGAPTDGSAWEIPAVSFRVLRGGYWDSSALGCRSAYRGGYTPGLRGYSFGLRLLRTP